MFVAYRRHAPGGFLQQNTPWESAQPSAPTRLESLGLGAIVALGAALRLSYLGDQALWFDEALSLEYARLPFSELMARLSVADVNTPFFYLLLKGMTLLGDSEFLLRLPSALAGILCLPVLHALGRRLGGPAVGLLAALLLATSSIHVRYSQEVRPYTLMALAAGLALWGLARLLQRGGHDGWGWATYVLGTSLALHCHSTMVLLPFLANVAALAWWLAGGRGDRRFPLRWVGANAVVVVLWSPVLALVARHIVVVLRTTWMHRPDAHAGAVMVSETYAPAAEGWGITALFVLMAAAGVWAWRRRPLALLLTLTFAAGVPALTFLISFWRPIMLSRTILWPTLPFAILLAAGCLALRPRVLSAAAVIFLVAAQGVAVADYFDTERPEPWDEITGLISRHVEPGDAIVVQPWTARIPFRYYFRALPDSFTLFGLRLDHPHDREREPGVLTLDDLPALAERHARVWLVLRNPGSLRGWTARAPLEQAFDLAAQWQARNLEAGLFTRRQVDPDAAPP